MRKAVSLFSGSPSSIVVTALINNSEAVQIVNLLTFRSPFYEEYERVKNLAHTFFPGANFRSQSVKKRCHNILQTTDSYESVPLRKACLGCQRVLLSRGKRFMERVEADFLATGYRPENGGVMPEDVLQVERNLGLAGRVFRPLAMREMSDTMPEEEGWVDDILTTLEESNYNLSNLSDVLGLRLDPVEQGYPSRERCKLTEQRYRNRFMNLLQEPGFTNNVLKLLEFDYYHKIPPVTKVVVAVSEQDKRELQNYFLPNDLRLYFPLVDGPMALVRSLHSNGTSQRTEEEEEMVRLAARISASYGSDADLGTKLVVHYRFENENETSRMSVRPLPDSELQRYLLDSGSRSS